VIRYAKLGLVELNVTDLSRSRSFYEDVVGLQFIGTGGAGELQFRCDGEHHSVSLFQSSQAGLKRVGLMLEDSEQFAALKSRLDVASVQWQ